MDEPSVYQIELSNSEREKQISCIKTYIYIYMESFQGRNRDMDIGNGLVDTGKREGRVE